MRTWLANAAFQGRRVVPGFLKKTFLKKTFLKKTLLKKTLTVAALLTIGAATGRKLVISAGGDLPQDRACWIGHADQQGHGVAGVVGVDLIFEDIAEARRLGQGGHGSVPLQIGGVMRAWPRWRRV